jgi:4'-phosphopantetheinyl transferase
VSPDAVRLAWSLVPPGSPRREIAWNLLRGLAPGARLSNPCPRCGGPHGPVRVDGAEVAASVTYAGDYAIVAVVGLSDASGLGIDAELAVDPRRDAAGFRGVLGEGRPADVRAWTRVEAALKADGRGVRLDPARVEVIERPGGWTARMPGRAVEMSGLDLVGPPGTIVSAALVASNAG